MFDKLDRYKMTSQNIERKIAVIFATDVVGYSKHIESDESATITNLRACEILLKDIFKKYNARLFNTGGDSFFAEFESAVTAVDCAVEFQNAIKRRNSTSEATVKLEFRIGINVGDVIKEKGNLLGDGVNIAARLESLAQAGGISISKGIFEYVSSKTKYSFVDQGIQQVKSNQFHIYDVILDPKQKRKLKSKLVSKKSNIFILMALILFAFVSVTYFTNLFLDNQNISNNRLSDIRPKIIILPFEIQSSEDKFITDHANLSFSINNNLSDLNTDITFIDSNDAKIMIKEKLSYKDLAENNDVSYVVTGAVQKSKELIRIQFRVVEAVSSETIFKEQYDFPIDENMIKVQEKLAMYLMKGLSKHISSKQHVFKYTNEPSTYFDLINIDKAILKSTVESVTYAGQLLQENLKSYPNDPHILQLAAFHTFASTSLGLVDDPASEINKAIEYLSHGIKFVNQADPIYLYLFAQKSIYQAILQQFNLACSIIPDLKKYENRIYDDHLSQFDFGLLYQICSSNGNSKDQFELGLSHMERSIELRPSSFNTKYLAYGYAYLTYKYGMSTEKLESLWISEKSKSQHNDEMALQTISALLAYSYAKKKENKLASKTLEISNKIGRKYNAQIPFSDYPAFQSKEFLADIGKTLIPLGLSN